MQLERATCIPCFSPRAKDEHTHTNCSTGAPEAESPHTSVSSPAFCSHTISCKKNQPFPEQQHLYCCRWKSPRRGHLHAAGHASTLPSPSLPQSHWESQERPGEPCKARKPSQQATCQHGSDCRSCCGEARAEGLWCSYLLQLLLQLGSARANPQAPQK